MTLSTKTSMAGFLSFFFLSLSYSLTFSQNPQLFTGKIVGSKVDMKYRDYDERILSKEDANGGFYFLHENANAPANTSTFLDKFDGHGKFLLTKELNYNPGSNSKRVSLIKSFDVKGKSYFLTTDYGKSGESIIRALEMDNGKMTLASTPKVIGQTDKSNSLHSVSHQLIISPDSTKFCLVSLTSGPYVSDKQHAIVFDGKLNVLWEEDFLFPFSLNRYSMQDCCLNNDGSVNFLMITAPKGDLYTPFRMNLDCSVANWKLYKLKGKDEKVYDIKLKEGDISFPRIVSTASDVIVTGFYSQSKGYNIRGIFSIHMDINTGTITSQNANPTPADFFEEKLKPLNSMGNWTGWNILFGESYNDKAIEVLADGSVLWMAEQVFEMDSKYQTLRRRLGAICVKINPDNSFAYTTKIAKHQYYGSELLHTPIVNMIYNNSMYVLFLDEKSNATNYDASKSVIWNDPKSEPEYSALMIAKVKDDGSYTKELVESGEDVRFYKLAIAKLFSNGNVIMPNIRLGSMGSKLCWITQLKLK